MLIRQKKKVKGIIIVSIFISIILSSSIQAQFLFNPTANQENGFNQETDDLLRYSYKSDLSDHNITGTGTPQEVRVFFSNQSESLDKIGSFNISAPANNMALSYGDLNFSFQNNFTTEYILEENSALYPEDHVQVYEFDTDNFLLTVNEGTTGNSIKGRLVDESDATFWTFTSVNDVLNFTIDGNFTGAIDADNNYAPFDRNNILGIINSLRCQINESSALLTIRMKNYTDSTWNTIVSNINVSNNLGVHDISEIIINENLHYIDLDDESHVEFVFQKTGDFDLNVYEISLQSTMGFELNITDTDYVALEFDLRGENTRVNGFYAWIRTLNVTEAQGKTLNISLYKADGLIARTAGNLRVDGLIEPNYSMLIDNINVPYLADNLSYFEFNLDNTKDLSYYNYFIVIKSDAPEGVYSLVTIPYNQYGDPEISSKATEHQLKITGDDGGSWLNADTIIGSYTSGQLDASSFKLNVTRGYMPSDFNGQFKIQDLELDDEDISFYPFNSNDPDYLSEWGKGTWTHDLTTAIPGNLNNDFQINLTWDHNITNGFEFNVTYSVKAYKIESALSTYNVKYDDIPNWNLNFTLNPVLSNWNFVEFWYIYPDNMAPYNLIDPSHVDIFDNSYISTFAENSNYETYNVSHSDIGLYSLNLTSINCISDVLSYINFDGTLWETQGFMYGDNISVKIDVQDHLGLAPSGGNANVTLFQDGMVYQELYSTNGVVSSNENVLYYDFGNQTILNLTSSDLLGRKYYLGYFWTNGTSIGCKKMQIYFDNYDDIMVDCTYLPDGDGSGKTSLDGKTIFDENFNRVRSRALLVASVNETTGQSRPGYYPISNLDVNEDYTYNIPFSQYDYSVSLLNFQQSENIINPEENVNFKLEIQNLDDTFDFGVKVKVQLVSYANNEWIINETTSDPINLNPIGETGNTAEFDIDLIIPTLNTNTKVWKGLNSPIRMGGAKTIFTVYIEYDGEYYDVGSYASSNYSLIVSQKENEFEGHILSLKIRDTIIVGKSFSQWFARDACLYNQSGLNSTFVINSYTDYYTSSYNQSIKSFPLLLNSKFDSITTDPENIYGDVFNFTSILMTEFGTILPGKNVTCQYKNGSSWVNISSQITDMEGVTNFEINTTTLNLGDSFTLKLLWWGNDTIMNCIKETVIDKVVQVNDIDFSFSISTYIIYKNSYNSLTIQLYNNGTSTMTIDVNEINIDVTGSLSTEIYYNAIEMQNLEPGESTSLVIEIYCGDVSFNQINVNISIDAQNTRSLETITFKSSIISLEVIDSPIFENLSWLISILIVSIIVAALAASIFYARNTRRKIKSSLEKPVQKTRPQRGRYVKVSEIKPATKDNGKKPDKIIKKAPETAKTSQQTTDLDSLLEEKGLQEQTKSTKKRPQSTQPKKIVSKTPKKIDPLREKLNKMNITRLREYSKDRKIKISSNDTKSQIIQKILDSKKNKK